jgi:hypothetical protein
MYKKTTTATKPPVRTGEIIPAKKRGNKPGNTGNPHGRPTKENSLTEILKLKLDKHKFVDLLIELAFKDRDPAIIKYIYDRYEGKIPENVTLGTEGGGNLRYEVTFRTVHARQSTETEDND